MSERVREFLDNSDPLTIDALSYVLEHREEDQYVDYKNTLDPGSEKHWLGLAKDVMAFANTHGGYLVFGVQDKTMEVVGLSEVVASTLSDTNNILQKVNRYAEPEITTLRSKIFSVDSEKVGLLFIPESRGRTHVVSKDGIFKFPSGENRIVLRQGTVWVRRVAGNHLADSRDFDSIFDRRLTLFKKSVLGDIAKVVEAPADSEIFVLSQDPEAGEARKFIIRDSPDSVPVKGMSFTVSPATPEQEVAGWVSMWKANPAALPSPKILWAWYEMRHKLELTEENRLRVAQFCLLSDVPAFFWMRGLDADELKKVLTDSLSQKSVNKSLGNLVRTAAFFGKGFFNDSRRRLGERAEELSQRMRTFPSAGPRSLFSPAVAESRRKRAHKDSEETFRADLESQLGELATSVRRDGKEHLGVMDRSRAQAFDCYLYAQDDKYTPSDVA
jgi:hypothetical protein